MFPLLPLFAQVPTPSPQAPIVIPSPSPSPPIPSPNPLPTLAPRVLYRLPPQEKLPPQESLPRQREVLSVQEVRSLSGQLDEVPVFNSNSPELVTEQGILLSTFPNVGSTFPAAHLNYGFKGRFDVFSHHISKASHAGEVKSLFQGIILQNPTTESVTVTVLQGASYLTRPDALFINLNDSVEDPVGNVYSGPGSRVMSDLLRGRRSGWLPVIMTLAPGESRMLLNLPIPAGLVTPTSNGRSTLIRLNSSGTVYLASMAMYAPRDASGEERVPQLEDWQRFLATSNLAGPRDRSPTPLKDKNQGDDRMIYGRVAGVARGSQWSTTLADSGDKLKIPQKGRAFSYAISTLPRGTFGTGQVQSAPMLVRYPDTAYLANGNYGIQYTLTLPLHNNSNQSQNIAISLETPLKQDMSREQVLFMNPPEPKIFFRGTVKLRYIDDANVPQTRFYHIIQRRGQQGEALAKLNLKPGEMRSVEVSLLYPPDATPPQLLTVKTLD
jgi:Protein of unknown function (DUF3370)